MPFIKVNDIDVYYEISGSGPRLLFINGTGGDLRKKPNIFDLPFAKHFTVLAFDQRGLGQTSKPNEQYSMQGYANDAVALMKKLGWEKAHVMGVSFGGMVAQELAINYPEIVDKLILACTSAGGKGGESYPLHEISSLSMEKKAKKVIAISDIRMDKQWAKQNTAQYEQVFNRVMDGFRIGAGEPGRELGSKLQLEARKSHNAFSRLPSIKSKAFIAGGEYDGICCIANIKAINNEIKNSSLKLYPYGHLFFMQSNDYWKDVHHFLMED